MKPRTVLLLAFVFPVAVVALAQVAVALGWAPIAVILALTALCSFALGALLVDLAIHAPRR